MPNATDSQVRNDCRGAAYLINEQAVRGVDVEVPAWLTEAAYRARTENTVTRRIALFRRGA